MDGPAASAWSAGQGEMKSKEQRSGAQLAGRLGVDAASAAIAACAVAPVMAIIDR